MTQAETKGSVGRKDYEVDLGPIQCDDPYILATWQNRTSPQEVCQWASPYLHLSMLPFLLTFYFSTQLLPAPIFSYIYLLHLYPAFLNSGNSELLTSFSLPSYHHNIVSNNPDWPSDPASLYGRMVIEPWVSYIYFEILTAASQCLLWSDYC